MISDNTVINTKTFELKTTDLQTTNFNFVTPIENNWKLRVIEGPEYDFVKNTSKKNIFSSIFTVSNDSNRMGNRLTGVNIELTNQDQMVSCPMSVGTIQCPENGSPIILGCDSQTLGGYPRILQIARVDLHLIGQLRPNDSVSFERISINQAREEFKNQDLLFPF